MDPIMDAQPAALPVQLPRIAIQFCTQCRWMLRAAYFAQELLSTFATALGEVALQPATGGIFRVTIEAAGRSSVLWDRAVDGGFPETKVLKQRVRDIIEPERDLGHVDRHKVKTTEAAAIAQSTQPTQSTTQTTPTTTCKECQDHATSA